LYPQVDYDALMNRREFLAAGAFPSPETPGMSSGLHRDWIAQAKLV